MPIHRLVLAITICLHASAGIAQSPDPASVAREHYRTGSKYFDLGQFAEAAREYEAAFAADERALLLFNIGQAHRLAGNATRAILAYRGFLRRQPDSPHRAEVERHIAVLEAQSPAHPSEISAPPPQEPAPPDEPKVTPLVLPVVTVAPTKRPLHKRWRFWTGVGAVVAGTAIGLGVGLGLRGRSTGEKPLNPWHVGAD